MNLIYDLFGFFFLFFERLMNLWDLKSQGFFQSIFFFVLYARKFFLSCSLVKLRHSQSIFSIY